MTEREYNVLINETFNIIEGMRVGLPEHSQEFKDSSDWERILLHEIWLDYDQYGVVDQRPMAEG